MAFAAAKCTECGASIEVDDSKEIGICRHCGTTFVTQKVLTYYNTHITKNITKNIYGREQTEAQEYLARGETFLKIKDWDRAIRAFEEAANAEPENFKCWLGLMRSETKDFTDMDDTYHIEHYRKALAIANDQEKKIIKDLCEHFVNLSKEYREKKEKTEEKQQEEKQLLLIEKNDKAQTMRKTAYLHLAIATICICITILSFSLCVLFWQLLVPLGVIFIPPSILFLVKYIKSERKYQKLLTEIQELKRQSIFTDPQLDGFFKIFFRN